MHVLGCACRPNVCVALVSGIWVFRGICTLGLQALGQRGSYGTYNMLMLGQQAQGHRTKLSRTDFAAPTRFGLLVLLAHLDILISAFIMKTQYQTKKPAN